MKWNLLRSSLLLLCMAVPQLAVAQVGGSLPVATTVVVAGETTPGTVVRYDAALDAFAPSISMDDPLVYGVVAERPALVFVTDPSAVPVVAEGGALVRVSAESVVERGDVLIAGTESGLAVRAPLESLHPFAVVREVYEITPGVGEYLVWAEIGTARAEQALREQREAMTVADAEERTWLVSWWRAGVSAVVAVAALIFMLFSVRSAIGKALLAVGRNPRARTTIFALAAVSIVAVVAVGVAVLFVAVGILVLPLA